MNPLIIKIQERAERFDELFFVSRRNRWDIYCGAPEPSCIKAFHRSSLISLFKANIERLEKERKDENVEFEDESLKFGQQRVEDYRFGFNDTIDQEIAFMRETIKSLENE